MPYLWGRPLHGNQVIFGSGLVHLNHWSELHDLNISHGEAAGLMRLLESRVHALHPALENIEFTNRWGGPILITKDWTPIFRHHPRSEDVIMLGRWASEVMLDKRKLPSWNKKGAKNKS